MEISAPAPKQYLRYALNINRVLPTSPPRACHDSIRPLPVSNDHDR
ncbi:hypothetical protein [Streptomyces sp. NPDC001893]